MILHSCCMSVADHDLWQGCLCSMRLHLPAPQVLLYAEAACFFQAAHADKEWVHACFTCSDMSVAIMQDVLLVLTSQLQSCMYLAGPCNTLADTKPTVVQSPCL